MFKLYLRRKNRKKRKLVKEKLKNKNISLLYAATAKIQQIIKNNPKTAVAKKFSNID